MNKSANSLNNLLSIPSKRSTNALHVSNNTLSSVSTLSLLDAVTQPQLLNSAEHGTYRIGDGIFSDRGYADFHELLELLSAAHAVLPSTEEQTNAPMANRAQVYEVLTARCNALKSVIHEYEKSLGKCMYFIQDMLDERTQLQNTVTDYENRVASMSGSTQKIEHLEQSLANAESMLRAEVQRRVATQAELDKQLESYERLQARLRERKKQAKETAVVVEKIDYDTLLKERDEQIDQLNDRIREIEFQVDEWKVLGIKSQRRCEEIDGQRGQLVLEVAHLSKVETMLTEKNAILQKKLKDLIERNQQVSDNYQAAKKDDEARRSELEDLTNQLEESKQQIETLNRQRKQLQTEFNVLVKHKQDLFDKNRTNENLITRKDKEINDLKSKLHDTIKDYDTKLERSEERFWAISEKLSELEAKKTRNAQIDPGLVSELETRFKAKEEALTAEITKLLAQMRDKDQEVENAKNALEVLKGSQFGPRMEALRKIEMDLRHKLEEFALAEESMEAGFTCPRCVETFRSPASLSPCGHTYCDDCIKITQEENYNELTCLVCQEQAQSEGTQYIKPQLTVRNDQLESILEHFNARKQQTKSFLTWIQQIQLPE